MSAITLEQDDRETQSSTYDPLHARFGFTLDVAATEANAKCARYFTALDDGLAQSWAGHSVWCNPPYSGISRWVSKAWREHATCPAIVMLLPAVRTEQPWWQAMVEPYRDRPRSPLTVEFLAGRLKFTRPGQSADGLGSPPFGCCLLIWQPLVFHPERFTDGLFGDAS